MPPLVAQVSPYMRKSARRIPVSEATAEASKHRQRCKVVTCARAVDADCEAYARAYQLPIDAPAHMPRSPQRQGGRMWTPHSDTDARSLPHLLLTQESVHQMHALTENACFLLVLVSMLPCWLPGRRAATPTRGAPRWCARTSLTTGASARRSPNRLGSAPARQPA
jgi:hypothetical protein